MGWTELTNRPARDLFARRRNRSTRQAGTVKDPPGDGGLPPAADTPRTADTGGTRGSETIKQTADALQEAATALEVAAEDVLDSDDLLLKEETRQVAAQVSEEHPLGLPGKPLGERSPVRFGFAAGIGLLLAAAVGEVIVLAGHVLVLLVIAALVAIGLEPVVAFMCHRGLQRGLAVAVVVGVGLTLTAVFIIQVVPVITNETGQITHQVPKLLHDLQEKNSWFGQLNLKYHLQQKVEKIVSVLQIGGVVLSVATSVVIVLVLVVYLLGSFPLLKEVFYRLFPRSRRPRVGVLGDEIISRIGGYALGNFLTSLIAILANYALLRILGVPYALVLSVFIGVLDLVPLRSGRSLAGPLWLLSPSRQSR
jgi:hypothetical protein